MEVSKEAAGVLLRQVGIAPLTKSFGQLGVAGTQLGCRNDPSAKSEPDFSVGLVRKTPLDFNQKVNV